MAREYAPKGFNFVFVYVRERRREGQRLTAFYAEFAGFRKNDRAEFMEGLKLAGQQAVDDFARMMQHWAQEGDPGRLDV